MAYNSHDSNALIIVGGGFAGLTTALSINRLDDHKPIILIEPKPRFVFLPLLYELLSREIEPWEIAPPYTTLLSGRGVSLVSDKVKNINTSKQCLVTSSGLKLGYKKIIICTGSKLKNSEIPGLKEHALTFQSPKDVEILRKKIKLIREISHNHSQNLVIIGAGPTGVELACKLSDLLQSSTKIHLIESQERILPNAKSFNQEQSEQALEKRGVKLHLKTRIISLSETTLMVRDYQNKCYSINNFSQIGVISTIGMSPVIPNIFPLIPLTQSRLPINSFFQVKGLENVFALGDAACNEEEPLPTNAQAAIQQGKGLAQILLDMQAGEPVEPFRFKELGEMLSLGVGDATMTGFGLTLSGPLAFQLRRMTYLTKLPRLSLGLRSASAWFLKP